MPKIETIRREYEPGKFTTDVYVNGIAYTRAVGDSILTEVLQRISARVNRANR